MGPFRVTASRASGGVGRPSLGLALAFWSCSILVVGPLQGCGFSTSIISEDADEPPQELTQSAEPLPIRAVIKPGGNALTSLHLAPRVRETKLFAGVLDLSVGGEGDRSLRSDDVIVRLSRSYVADYDSGIPWRAILCGIGWATLIGIVLMPLALPPGPLPDYEIPYELTLTATDGKVVYRAATKQTVGVWAQAFASDTEIQQEAEELTLDAAERTLLARLVEDKAAHAVIVKAAQGAAPLRRAGPPAPAAPVGPGAVTAGAETPSRPGATAGTPPTATTPPSATSFASGRTFVLIVGVNGYADPGIPNLRFAESDARSVYGFYATDRRSPTDGDRVRVLLGQGATRQRILRAVREHLLQKATGPNDTAVLFFAGHGFADASDTYLATADTTLASLPETAIAMSTLQTYWGRIAAGRKVLVTDACHTGGLAGLRGIGGVSLAPATSGKASPFSTSITVTATGPNQLSLEDENLGHGIFTNTLLNGLRGDADSDRDGHVTAGELRTYLLEEVPRQARAAGGSQLPVVSVPAGREALPLTR